MFTGLDLDSNDEPKTQEFDYAIICKFDETFTLQSIYELDWDLFLKHKHWNSRLKNWYLLISKALIEDAKTIYDVNKRG